MNKKQTPESLYQSLRNRIISMELIPGQDLEEQALVKEYGVSRTPIREALIRLSAEGLVQTRKNRSATVAPMDVVTLRAYFEANALVQSAVVRMACHRRKDTDLEKIKSAMQAFEEATSANDKKAMIIENNRFHSAIAAAAHSQYLYDSYIRLLAEHQRISELTYNYSIVTNDHQTKKLTCQQHLAIYRAILKQDAIKAETISLEHSDLCKNEIARALLDPTIQLNDIIEEVLEGQKGHHS